MATTQLSSPGFPVDLPRLRRALERLTATSIAMLDVLDGDADLEPDDEDIGVEDGPEGFDPEEDMCLAGDDRVMSGSCTGAGPVCEDTGPGDADDAEEDFRRAPRR